MTGILAHATTLPADTMTKRLSENSALGSTGYQPVPSGDSPDGTASASAGYLDARFPATTSPIPVGGSPTGMGESPAPPIFQAGSKLMHQTFIVILGWIIVCQTVSAASTITAPDGRQFVFGDWRPGDAVPAVSAEGGISLLRQTINVHITNPKFPASPVVDFQIEAVFHAVTGERLFSLPDEKYWLIDGKIHGIRMDGRWLQVHRSENTGPSGVNLGAARDKIQSDLLQDLRKVNSLETAAAAFDLSLIYPLGALIPLNDSRPWGKLASIVDLRAGAAGMEILLSGPAQKDLTLVISKDLQIQSASIAEEPHLVLRQARYPRTDLKWAPAQWRPIESCDGPIMALSCLRQFEDRVDSENHRLALRAVAVNSGRVWIGPENCRLVLAHDVILGFRLRRGRVLEVFSGSKEKLPLGAETSTSFESLLSQTEGEVAKTGKITETLSFDLFSLFADDRRVIQDSEIVLKEAACDASGVWISLRVTQHRLLLKINLTSDLRVAGTSKTEPE
jgi:hypothetical protein